MILSLKAFDVSLCNNSLTALGHHTSHESRRVEIVKASVVVSQLTPGRVYSDLKLVGEADLLFIFLVYFL